MVRRFTQKKNTSRFLNALQQFCHGIYYFLFSVKKTQSSHFLTLRDVERNRELAIKDHVRSFEKMLSFNFANSIKMLTIKRLKIHSHYIFNISGFAKLIAKTTNLMIKILHLDKFKMLASTLLVFLALCSSAFAIDVDLSLTQSVSNPTPQIGDDITYTIKLKNNGNTNAGNVGITTTLPYGPVLDITSNVTSGIVNNTGSGIITWNVASLAAGDSATLTINATVMAEGVYFSNAEITSMVDTDIDSVPGNGSLSEDDVASSCFSVPIEWYPGDEFTVTIPAPYTYGDGITWYRDGMAITPSTTEATVNADSSLTIKAPGNYTFTTTYSTCPASGCCAIQIIPTPLGAIGDYVWIDLNEDGVQNSNEVGAPGIIVNLLDSLGNVFMTDTTDANGKYLFPNLLAGNYQIQIVQSSLPTDYVFTSQNTIADNLDSDVDNNGLTIQINLAKGEIDTTWDAGIYPAPQFDLALSKTSNATSVVAGGSMTFTFNVFNQGSINATQIQITDSIPSGLILNDTNWVMNGNTAQLVNPIASLAAGASTSVTITFDVAPNANGSLSNFGEISDAKGPNGETVTDKDSDMDTNPNNDLVIDGITNQDGKNGGDEDDSDISTFTVTPAPIFDLALRKTLADAGPFAPGSTVQFNLEVINQGSIEATQINLVDYIPTGLTLADNNWTQVGNTATYNFPFSVVAGNATTIPITFMVNPNVAGTLENSAEITSARDKDGQNVTDIDSNPDNIPDNDTVKDDVVNENGQNGQDEDDSDLSLVTIDNVFDLAMTKTSNTTSVVAGGSVTYTFNVFNQGNITATDIQITDHIPSGLTLADANWTVANSMATLNNPIASLAPGASTFVSITFNVNANATGSLQNFGEISSAKGPNGENQTDIDSDMDNNPNNDLVKNDVINEDGKIGGDEDDSDTHSITVTPAPVFDLALRKTLNSTAPHSPGDLISFNLEVINQGSLDATQINLVDYIPAGLTLADNNWTATGNTATYNFPFSVVAGNTTTIPIYFTINANASGNLSNGAEIRSAAGPNGQPATDIDSNPDNNSGNDTVKNDVVNENGQNGQDEDDSDIETFTVTPLNVCETIAQISAANSEICSGQSNSITATSSSATAINWYLVPTGGSVLFTTNSGAAQTVSPTTTTVYYAQLASIQPGCPTVRSAVAVVVNALPSTPSCGNIVEICDNETIDLNTLIINGITSPGGIFEWHTGANPNSPIVVNATSVGAGTYYLFEKSGTGCYSNPAVAEVATKTCEQTIDLSLIKIADRRTINLGDNITYTITVNNAGPDVATNVVIEDILPAGLTFVSSGTFTNSAGVLSANIASIAVNQTITLTYIAQATGAGAIINVAQVLSADQIDEDSTPGNAETVNEDDDDDEVINVINPTPLADLSLAKYVDNNTPEVGNTVTYTIMVTNNGPSVATNVEVKDILPVGLTYVSSTSTNTSALAFSAGTVTASFAQINVGQTVEFVITANVTGTGSISNRAEVTKADQQDPDSNPNSGTNEDDDDTVVITPTQACNPTTPIIACANPYICLGESTVISALNCNGTVLWSNGATGAQITVTPTISTIYTAKCIVGTCESNNSNSVAVVVNNLSAPLITASKTNACSGEAIILTASTCSGSIVWSNGSLGSSIIVNPTATTTYTAKCRVATCESNASLPITITISNSLTAPVVTASNTNICIGESVTLSATGCTGTLSWSNGAVGVSTIVTPNATTTYTAICTNGTCSSPNSNAVIINVGSGQTPTITTSNQNICSGSTSVLTVNNCNSSILWSTGATTSSITVSPTASTTYSVTCGTGTCSGSASTTINVSAGSSIIITTAQPSICAGATTTLNASNCSGSVSWSNGAVGNSIAVSPVATTTYTATCTTGTGCTSTATATVNVTPKPIAPIVTCGRERICAGEVLTFTAHNCAGTVTWQTGANGTTTEIAPTTTGAYWATCTVNGCESERGYSNPITVLTETPTITASSNDICAGQSVTLTATNCSGTIGWNNGQNTASITVNPTVTTSYTVTCIVEGCVGTANLTVNVNNGQIPTITATKLSICAGESIILNASNCTSGLLWSTGATTSNITVSPTNTTNYTVTCGSGSCAGTASVSIAVNSGNTPTITASSSSICAGENVTLSAANCASTLLWSTGATTSSITVSPTSTTNYTVTCGTGACSGTANLSIVVNTGSTPTIAASKTSICAGESVTLSAANCASTLLWSTGATTNSITVSPTSTTIYTVTCGTGACSGVASVSIGVGTGSTPTITASNTSICTGEAVTLTVSNCNAVISWNTGQTTPSITVNPISTTNYSVVCGSGACTGTANTNIVVNNGSTPTISASKTSICQGESVTLSAQNCNSTISWNTGQTTNTITVNPSATTSYTVTCGTGTCAGVATATIAVGSQETPVITASKTEVCNGETLTLTASACATNITWSTGQTGNQITVTPSFNNNTFTATCGTGTCQASSTYTATVIPTVAPTISANKTQLCTAENVVLTATGCNGTVNWSNGQTGNSITVNVTTTSSFTAVCNINTCTSNNSNTITVTVGQPSAPTISSNGNEICASSSVILTAANCSGNVIWSNGQTGTSITVSPANTTSYTAVCELAGTNCTSTASNAIEIRVVNKPTAPTITCDLTRICLGDNVTLNAIGCNGTVTWSTGQTGLSIVVAPTQTTVYLAKCQIGSCESVDSAPATITVGKPIAPIVSCQSTVICLGSSVLVQAEGCVGTVKWSNGQEGAIITVSPTTMTSYNAVCDAGICESDVSNTVTVAVSGTGIAQPTVNSLINICPNTSVDLSTAITSSLTTTGGTYEYHTGNTPQSALVSNPSSVRTSGSYYVFETSGNGCYSPAAQIDVAIISCETTVNCTTNPATVYAGKDTTICLENDFIVLNKATMGGAAQSVQWTTSGTGTFTNATALVTNYNYSFADVQNGNVTLTLTTNDPDNGGPCVAASSSFVLTINAVKEKPVITANKSANICLGDSVILTVNLDGYNYKWSTGETTKSIVVKESGDYTVKLINATGCCSIASDIFEVNANSSIVAPTVLPLVKNVCPVQTANLTNAVTSQPSTGNGVFEYHVGINPSSDIITNVSALPEGSYYVFEKSSTGCYSTPATIQVLTDDCNTNNPGDADISITIVGDNNDVDLGSEVKFTITVTNNGPANATNVEIVNTLPSGLLVSATPGLIHVNNTLLATIPSLAVGESKQYTYTGTLLKAGTNTNKAQVVKAAQSDPVFTNNYSEYSVECATCKELCISTALNADTTKQSDGSYNIKFTALLEVCGNVNMTEVQLLENMSSMFTAPTTFTMVQAPKANTGSGLVVNPNYNGSTDINVLNTTSILNTGRVDTVTWVINLVPNGAVGPFSTNSIVKGKGRNLFNNLVEVSDISNDGMVIYEPFSDMTVVRLYKTPSIGLTLAIIDTVRYSNGDIDVYYQALVKNNGALILNNVILEDTLINTYASPVTYTMLNAPKKAVGSGLVLNPDYNGNTITNLTSTGSVLTVGKVDTVWFAVRVTPGNVKEFSNQAVVSGIGTLEDSSKETVTDISNTGYNPDAPGQEPTLLIISDEETSSVQTPCIGLALYIADTTKKVDGSFDITYHAIVRNCGNLNLTNITMCDTLANTFNSPSVVKMVSGPSLGLGSTLSVDNTFDGDTNTCLLNPALSTLAPNKTDTIKWTVNVTLNSNFGPFRNNVTVTGLTPNDQTIFDVSNDGTNPNPSGSAPTVMNFNSLPAELIGIAKKLVSIDKVEENIYDLNFLFTVKNYGIRSFDKVQVQDNLSATFGDSVIIDSVKVTNVSTGFVANPLYTGKGQLINLLVDSLSTLPLNTTREIELFTRVDISNADTSFFENMALAIGYFNDISYDDLSTDGTNPDPEADGTPENNSLPTPIDFGNAVTVNVTPLGIAKNISDTASVVDGSYIITYDIIVKNYGDNALNQIQLSDSLSKVFGDSTEIALVGVPTAKANSTLKVNSDFDGVADNNLLVADSSTLAAGVSDTITFKVKVRNNSTTAKQYNNTIYGIAKDGVKDVFDWSNEGLNPDGDNNGNPGNDNKPTSITLGSGNTADTTSSISIPGGISPNGDGNNDVLVIDGLKATDKLTLKVYNRWGELVFYTEDYKATYPGNKAGWDGIPNSGIAVKNGTTAKLPDGTYFYSAESNNTKHFNGKPYYNFLTIAGGTQK